MKGNDMRERIKDNRYKYMVLSIFMFIIIVVAAKVYHNPYSILAKSNPGKYEVVKVVYLVLALVVVVMFAGFAWLAKKKPIEKITLYMIIFFGLMYMVVLPPYSTPDEAKHINTAYYYSNVLMGKEAIDQEGHTLYRKEDTYYTHGECKPTAKSYSRLLNRFFSIEKQGETVCMNLEPLSVPPTAYLPQIIGVTIARTMHLGNIQMLMFGRIMSLIFFAICVYFTIKISPLGKEIFMVASLLPTTMQLATSFSYDVITISLVFVYTGYLFYLLFTVKKIEKKHWIFLAVLFAWMSPVKVVYVLLGFTLLIIPKDKFDITYQKYLFPATIVLVGVLGIAATRLTSVMNVAVEGAFQAETYSLDYLLRHPKKIFTLGFFTVMYKSDYYLDTMIGHHLGWLEIDIPHFIIYAYFSLIIIASIRTKEESNVLNARQRLWVFIVVAASTFFIGLALCLDWTPVTSVCVEGIQGRYLTPMLPMLMILFKNNQIEMKESMTKYLEIAVYLLQALTILNIALIIGSR